MVKLDYTKRKPNGLSVGDILTTKDGLNFEIIEYLSSRKVRCRFIETGYVTDYVQAGNVVRGVLRDLKRPSVEGVGFIGQGDAPLKLEDKPHPIYRSWRGMFIRSYSNNYHKTRPTYKGCSVAEEWHDYQVFYEWAKVNYRTGYQLDKDILIKGNKVYSKETCSYVPQEVNMIVNDNESRRGDCPLGVSKRKKKGTQEFNGLFTVGCSTPKGLLYLGRYTCEVEGFSKYKEFKELLYKVYAEAYYERGMITKGICDALMKREVFITD